MVSPTDTAPINSPPSSIQTSTVGMTTKVVKGSLWTLAGQVLPMMVAFVSTPFVIRLLGSEAYGVLILVGLIPTYFSFADFGMGVASTKFAAEAHGEGDEKKEVEVVWTATTIAAISSLSFAIPIFTFSYQIVRLLNVPEYLLSEASIALKLTSGSFFLGILASVINSPMLARLRMDLNMLTSAIPKILLAVITPFVLYFGGGIDDAAGWAFIVAISILGMVIYFSARLMPLLLSGTPNRELVRPLIKVGGAWFIAMIASLLLGNFEKLALSRLISVQSLAYYSIAFTVANMTTLFAQAMIQSLVPAFSQLLTSEKRSELVAMCQRGVRMNLVLLLPAVTLMLVAAKPLFTVWLGEEFGRESSFPFYILAFGLFLNLNAHIQYSFIIAHGRTDVLAKLYWLELTLYFVLVVVLINWLGVAGAALAWSIRVVFDAAMVIWISSRVLHLPFVIPSNISVIGLGFVMLCIPLLFAGYYGNFSPWLLVIAPATLVSYAILIWHGVLEPVEKAHIRSIARI